MARVTRKINENRESKQDSLDRGSVLQGSLSKKDNTTQKEARGHVLSEA